MSDWYHDGGWMVTQDDPTVAVPSHSGAPTLLLEYGEQRVDNRENCNAYDLDTDSICRLWKGHENQHVPFTRMVVATTDVYILELQW